MAIDYNTEDGIVQAALRVKQTIIPDVLDGKEFWILFILNLAIVTMRKHDIITPEAFDVDLPWHLTGVTGSLMTFFVCFYNGHQFGRYNRLYDVTQDLLEIVVQLCSKLRVEISDRQLRRKVSKLVTGSVVMFFFERSGGCGDDGKVSRQEFYQLWQLQLLEEDEIRALRSHCRNLRGDSVAAFLLLQWAMELLMSRTPEPENREDFLAGIIQQMYKIRGCQAFVIQTMELPMPFQYFHIMNFMLILNLVLWAYSLACQDSYFAPFIYIFVQMMFQGIRELSTSLSDPWGSDDVDFQVNDWLYTLYFRVHSIMEDDFEPDYDESDACRMVELQKAKSIVDAHVDNADQSVTSGAS
jgi:predicted membrane chloride channel (bestrophin family)